jgi:2-oxoglutarate dehydrogenase E2 component (dihydrolipoamide succinyltransferase)
MNNTTSRDVIVPTMGESITEATIAKWLKNKGDAVALDEPLVELETDKVTLEVSAPCAGVLSEVFAKEGDVVEVGAIIGRVTQGESPPPKKEEPKKEEVQVKPAIVETSKVTEAIPLSPAVRKLATENQITPEKVQGTGKDGRITKGDVLTYIAEPQKTEARVERVRMSRLRQRIAERLKEAQNTAAILTTFNEADMTNIMDLRSQLKDSFEKRHGVKLGFMSFFVKACIVALKEIPAVNAEIDGDELVYKNYYDIGVAVGTPQGLVVPVVRDADKKSFSDIEKDVANLGQKARDGKLSMEDLTGGTFTISNGGIYGSLMSTPILNPPQSGILGMHKIQERPVALNGQIVIRPMMYLALSYDHRIIDGKEAVTFLVRVKECLENPERILLGM